MASVGSDSLSGGSCWDGLAASAAVWSFATRPMSKTSKANKGKTWNFFMTLNPFSTMPPNGLRYLRWGGDGEAVQPEKS